MRYTSFIFAVFLFFTLLTSCTHKEKKIPRDIASFKASGVEGIWFLQGTSSTRGPYNGELELRKENDGTFSVTRVVTYINNYFDGLKVQEIWTGKAVAEGEFLTISYDIKQADFITKLDGQKRSKDDFKTPLQIISKFQPTQEGLAATFSDRKVSSYSEWITTKREIESKPLWQNKRKNIEAGGVYLPVDIPLLAKGLIAISKKDIGFDKDPLVLSYKNRQEFKDQMPYLVVDPTDFEFYRDNKNFIRVVNKVTDNISITESVVRRNAYAPTLREKQESFESNTKDFHINELGMISLAQLNERGQLMSYVPDVDSALWTGMYVASQAMRYKVTSDKEALFNIRRAMRGIFALIDVTGDPKEFARTLAVYSPTVSWSKEWIRGKGPYENVMWLSGGNNDMIKGLIHAMAWAAMVVPETDREMWDQLRDKSKKLLGLKVIEDEKQNKFPVIGLISYIHNDKSLLESYRGYYLGLKANLRNAFSSGFYYKGVADWSGINLSMVGNITDIVVAQLLEENRVVDKTRENMMDQWVTYQSTQRHLLTMAAYAFAYKYTTRGGNFRSHSSDEKFETALKDSTWGLREIPYPRPNLNVEVDHSLRPDWCLSPIPRMFWKSASKPEAPIEYFYQGLYNYPTFELNSFSSGFLWKDSAFAYKTSHAKGMEYASVDYLYAYWLGRYGEILSGNYEE